MARRPGGMFPGVVVVVVIVIGIVGGRLPAVIESMVSGGRRGRRRQRSARRRGLLHGALDLLLDAAGCLLEFPNRAGKAAREVGQTLSAEEEQDKDEDEQQLGATDVSDEREDGRNQG